ncbi:immunoglobulin E-set domain-containing protein [Heterostelium album PN500]|uniref:Immunoglobulin E-set domain-containing protein n=1 Tax=Heterostelium pallidum (strain ATCC 26659 / Pp 5 / PN500) TaxID=670386 RepID=D3B8E1_HETP5|nr:immunoglobulin E-set domain-containing protein [Heterostelium album PN500]EFA82309.1 immunoglobulin E-set domain-containing protein [Heterostelium album PN500]|eukprot:XP_020434426.1 immunoglobulin E-set domain-containing protein [Heterostelium album PN500]
MIKIQNIVVLVILLFFGEINGQTELQSVQYGPDGVTVKLSSGTFTSNSYSFKLIGPPVIQKTMDIFNPTTAFLNYTADIINKVDKFQICDLQSCLFPNEILWNPVYITNISSIPTQGGIITVKGVSLLPTQPGCSEIYFNKSIFLYESNTNSAGTEINFNVGQNITSLFSGQNIPISFRIRGTNILSYNIYVYKTIFFSFQGPTISSVVFNRETNQITMTGTNFGVNGIPLTLTSNGGNLQPTHLIDNTVIVSKVNAQNYSFSGDFQYVLNVGSPNPNSATYTQQIYPVVTSVTSTSSSGGTISIYGYILNLFKPNATISQVSILVGGYTCTVLTLNDPTNSFIECLMPAITSGSKNYNLSVVVNINGKHSNSDILFSADLSNVQEVSQDGGNTIIIGSSFGNDTKSIVLHFNGSTPMSPISVSDSMLTFKFPTNTPSGLYNGNTLTKFNTSTTIPFKITIQPYITSITSPPTQGGIVTISGQYMTSNIQGNENITVIIYYPKSNLNTLCSNATRLNSTSVTCIAPQGSGTSVNLELQLNGISSTVVIVERSTAKIGFTGGIEPQVPRQYVIEFLDFLMGLTASGHFHNKSLANLTASTSSISNITVNAQGGAGSRQGGNKAATLGVPDWVDTVNDLIYLGYIDCHGNLRRIRIERKCFRFGDKSVEEKMQEWLLEYSERGKYESLFVNKLEQPGKITGMECSIDLVKDECVKTIIDRMKDGGILKIPDLKDFVLETDASGVGIGCALFQNGMLVIAYSRKLTAAEKNYHSDTSAFFIAVTDNQALKVLNDKSPKNARILRWSMFLQGFNYVIRYRAGKHNDFADGLSRFPTLLKPSKDDFCIKIRKALEGTELKAPADLPLYSLEDDILYFNYDHSKVNPFSSRVLTSRIWVPLSLRHKVMSYYRDDLLTGGHLVLLVDDHLGFEAFITCAVFKGPRYQKRPDTAMSLEVSRPFELIGVDLMVARSIALPDYSAVTFAGYIYREVICRYA